jgi:hypothetical protein
MTNETIADAYFVLTDDGNQYGPVSESELRMWIRDGRIQRHTQIWLQGSPDWKPLSDFPNFSNLLPPPAPARPKPPIPSRPAIAQDTETTTIAKSTIICSYVISVLMPLFGFFAGIYLIAKKQTGHGVACMALSIFMFLVYISMMNS